MRLVFAAILRPLIGQDVNDTHAVFSKQWQYPVVEQSRPGLVANSKLIGCSPVPLPAISLLQLPEAGS
jgi:hypothetical protein